MNMINFKIVSVLLLFLFCTYQCSNKKQSFIETEIKFPVYDTLILRYAEDLSNNILKKNGNRGVIIMKFYLYEHVNKEYIRIDMEYEPCVDYKCKIKGFFFTK